MLYRTSKGKIIDVKLSNFNSDKEFYFYLLKQI